MKEFSRVFEELRSIMIPYCTKARLYSGYTGALNQTLYGALLLLVIIQSAGCASYNQAMFKINDRLDDHVLVPVSKAYKAVTPVVVNKGITNFFSNLDDVVVFVNDLLQLKFQQAASDLARVFFNTTIGLAGFFDVASYMDFPKHNEDFGQTLGHWGVPPGPYIVLPLLGPSTLRDSFGLGLDSIVFDPTFNYVEQERVGYGAWTLNQIDQRADLPDNIKDVIEEAAIDGRFEFIKNSYLQRRKYLVYDGEPPEEEEEEFLDNNNEKSSSLDDQKYLGK